MSQSPYQVPDPYYNAHQPYGTANSPPGRTRPASITVMAVLGIVFGIQGLLGACYSVFGNTVMLMNGGANPMFTSGFGSKPAPPMDPILAKVGLVQAVIEVFFAAVMLIAGIGALKLRPGARTTMIVWSWLSILRAIAATIVGIVWLVAPITNWILGMGLVDEALGASFCNTVAVTVFIVAGVFGLIMPILYLALWTRPKVKSAFGVV